MASNPGAPVSIQPNNFHVTGNQYELGPSGGIGGQSWHWLLFGDRLNRLHVLHGAWIDGLVLESSWVGGFTPIQQVVGGDGGSTDVAFELTANEALVVVSGTYGNYLNSLHFEWRELPDGEIHTSDIAGWDTAAGSFRFEAPEGYAIVGLRGRAHTYLDAIGVIIAKFQ